MNVLFITDNYILEKVDGVYFHRCIDEHIKAYQSLGSIRLCLPVSNTVSISRKVDLSGIGVREIHKENNIRRRFFDRTYNKQVIEEEVMASDIIVAFVPSSVCSLAQVYAQKHNKVFLSVVIASAWDILWYHSLKGKFMAPISHFNTKKTIRNSNYVVYVTEKYLQKKYPTNGVSIGLSDVVLEDYDESAAIRKKCFFEDKKDLKHIDLMSIGAIDVRYKGHADVLRAMSLLVKEGYDIHYWLIGGGSDHYIKTIAEKYSLESRLHLMGALPHEEIFQTFESIDIYVQPSHTEGMPRAIIEAMSRAVPVICSNAGGMPELIEDHCIYSVGDISGLTDKIRTLASSQNALIMQSQRNHIKAADFQKNILKEKRDTFLSDIKNRHEL